MAGLFVTNHVAQRSRGVAILLLTATTLFACDRCNPPWESSEHARPDPTETQAGEAHPAANAAEHAHARQLYTRYCALCHGENGQGYAADNANALFHAGFLKVADNAFIASAIRYGRPGTPMAAWSQERGGPLTQADIEALVAYIGAHRVLDDAPLERVQSGGVAARGGVIFSQQCATCHGDAGEGVSAVSLSHPYFQASASDAYLAHTIKHGRPGTPMSAFEIPNVGMSDLVAFLRQLPAAPQVATVMQHLPPPPGMRLAANAAANPDTALTDLPIEALPSAEHLVIHPDGAAPTFTLREERYVSAEQVNAALTAGKRLILLDARATSDWAARHIRGAAPFPFYSVDELVRRLPRNGTFIVAYCACPHAASGHVVDQLRERGFRNTAVLDEGIQFWIDHNYPTARGELPAPAATEPQPASPAPGHAAAPAPGHAAVPGQLAAPAH